MANFIVTFRFEADDTYSERYTSFVKQVKELAKEVPWDETSSFYVFESDLTADSLCTRLWTGSEFDSSKDIMVVVDVLNRVRATKGPIKYPNLLASHLGF